MEGAVRIFAGEFDQATLTVPDEADRSSPWIVSPSGAFCRQVFLAGALVSVRGERDQVVARLADPTGGFDLVCSGTGPVETFRKITPPAFVSVTGRALMYGKEPGWVRTIRPDIVHLIDRQIRDRWVVTTAAATLERLEQLHLASTGNCTDERILVAYRHYSPKPDTLNALAEMVAGALAGVRPAGGPVTVPETDPRDLIMEYIRSESGPRGVSVESVLAMAGMRAVSKEAALAALESLIIDDECYQPQKGYVKPL